MRSFSSRPSGRLKRGYARSNRDQSNGDPPDSRITASDGSREKAVEETFAVVFDGEKRAQIKKKRRFDPSAATGAGRSAFEDHRPNVDLAARKRRSRSSTRWSITEAAARPPATSNSCFRPKARRSWRATTPGRVTRRCSRNTPAAVASQVAGASAGACPEPVGPSEFQRRTHRPVACSGLEPCRNVSMTFF